MRATIEQPASLSLLDGDLLEDLDGIDPTFDAWLAAERERVRDRARTVAEALLRDPGGTRGRDPGAQRLLSIDRAHEGAWRALMRAHAARGERGMAIQAYDRCRAVLADLLDAAAIAGDAAAAGGDSRPVGQPGPRARRARRRRSRRRDEPPPMTCEPKAAAQRSDARGGAHVGVLPLQLVGTSEDEAHLATGLAEEITTALARFRWMFVVSSSSLARFAIEIARRSGDPAHLRHRFPAGRHHPEGARRGCASRCACSICAPATRWCGRAGSIARPTTCCRCRTRSPPRWWRRSTRRSC